MYSAAIIKYSTQLNKCKNKQIHEANCGLLELNNLLTKIKILIYSRIFTLEHERRKSWIPTEQSVEYKLILEKKNKVCYPKFYYN